MNTIYLAGPCDTEHRTLMVNIKTLLETNLPIGWTIYAPWELKIPNAWDYSQEDWAQMVFDVDVETLEHSDYMIMVSTGRDSTAGTNWEQGYAYAKGIPVIVLQITPNTTSLMTYCGCNIFLNNNADDMTHLRDDLRFVADVIKTNDITQYYRGKCKSVLT